MKKRNLSHKMMTALLCLALLAALPGAKTAGTGASAQLGTGAYDSTGQTAPFGQTALFALSELTGGIAAYAATDDETDYTIDGASWNDVEGRAIADWEKPESATRYSLQLYRGISTKVGNAVTSGTTTYDFSQAISKKGTGNYFYEVTPIKGGSAYTVRSDVLEVDSDMMSAIRAYLKEKKADAQAAAVAGEARWVMNPNGTWQYVNGQGGYAKNEWMQIDGKWYYFGSDTLMKTGWQKVGKYWYYLGTDGAMWENATTPDGYVVNESGVWIDPETGNAAASTKSGDPNAPDPSIIYTVRLNLREENVGAGSFRKVEVRAPSNVTVNNVEFSQPYEQWSVGSSITITVDISAKQGMTFADAARYYLGSLTYSSSNGDQQNRRLTFKYYPKMTLATPDGVYISSDGVLRWNKVANAHQYRVVVKYYSEDSDSSSSRTFTVTTPQLDISEYTDGNYYDLNIRITAQASKSNRSYASDSAAMEISDFDAFAETNTLDGRFKTTSGSLIFQDESGDKLKGWQELAGYWYYFRSNGNAVDEGWFQDKEGGDYWYYFDAEHHMVTGTITVDGVNYFLNDGVYDSVPYGAWVENEY